MLRDVLGTEVRSVSHQPTTTAETLTPIVEGVSRALGYSRALVLLFDAERAALHSTIGLNVPDPLAESLVVPLDEPENPLVKVFLQGTPVRVDAVAREPRLDGIAALLEEMEIASFVAAPLRASARPSRSPTQQEAAPTLATGQVGEAPAVGVLLLSKDEPITDADIERLLPFATHAGTALVRASDAELFRGSSERYAIEKEWLWLMLNGVADPIVLSDDNNDILLQNMAAESLFKSTSEDSAGKRHAISMNNFLFTAALSASALDPRGGRAGRDLTLVDPIEGEELLFEVLSYPATNYFNAARGTVSVLKNVSELRQATEELTQNVQRLQSADEEVRQERDRLNLVLRSVPNPILLLDNDNQTLLMNQEAARLFQPPRERPSARRTQIALSNDTKFTSFVTQLRLEPTAVKQGELVLTDPDTEEMVTMAVTSTEVRDERGSAGATVSVMQDISRVRELERRRVEQVLFESEKLAATGRLAASIAHEINNPLEAIKNSLYLLSHRLPEQDPSFKFLHIATKETERVSRILRQMLGFYRPPKMEPTDVNALVEEAEALVEKHLRQSGVRIENELARDVPPIVASADQVKQVILNLLLNANDAMPRGGTITVSTRYVPEAEPGFLRAESVNIQIRDTGSGIAEEHIPHIFEPFFSTKLEGKGTGIGLWVSSGIIQNHGGSIQVRSRPGRGTTFTIALPIGGPSGQG